MEKTNYGGSQCMKFVRLSEEEAERVGHLMLNDPLWNELDLGVRTQDEIISDYLRKYKEDGKVMAWFLRHGEYMPVARPEIWDRVHELKKRGYTGSICFRIIRKTFSANIRNMRIS